MAIHIKGNRALIRISGDDKLEPSDEQKLVMIAWLVSDLARKLAVHEIELVFNPDPVPA